MRLYFDYTYIFVLIGVIISLLASMNVSATFRKYSKQRVSSGMPAQVSARQILESAGIYNVEIGQIRGNMTDHYSPSEKILRLSESVYGSASVAAVGVAAHECGHALQDDQGYGPLRLRSAAVPIANIGSKIAWPVILLGLVFHWMGIAQIGIGLFVFVVVFQLITLPVEFDASKRALRILSENQMLTETEMQGARKVLTAAAMTYVAAAVTSILQLLRLILIVNGRRR